MEVEWHEDVGLFFGRWSAQWRSMYGVQSWNEVYHKRSYPR